MKVGHQSGALGEYARRVLKLFERVGVLSLGGEPIDRDSYQPTMLESRQPPRTSPANEWFSNSAQDRRNDPGNSHVVATEEKVCSEWLGDDDRLPLCIIGEAGAGKSCLAESFGYSLCKSLLAWTTAPTEAEGTPPFVPLLIRLSEAAGQIGDAVRMAEAALLKGHAYPALNDDCLSALIGENRLAYVFDGLDEIPLPRRRGLFDQLRSFEGTAPIMVTSRPATGIEQLFSVAHIYAICETTLSQAIAYVRRYFGSASAPGRPPEFWIGEFRRAAAGPIGHYLSRWLYVKAWCDFCAAFERPPEGIAELMENAFRNFPARRRVLEDPAEAELRRFHGWLSRVAFHFAGTDFTPEPLDFEDKSSPAYLENVDRAGRFLKQAADAGLLLREATSGRYRVVKVPIIEYLVARRLVEGANASPLVLKRLIETFRRWVWRPETHDILQMALALLFCGGAASQELAMNLADWALRVSERSVRAKPSRWRLTAKEPPCDDIVLPFGFVIARWLGAASDNVIRPMLARIVDLAVAKQAITSRRIIESLAPRLSFPMVQLLLERMRSNTRTDDNFSESDIEISVALGLAATLLPECDAISALQEILRFLDEERNKGEPEHLRILMGKPVEEVVRRIAGSDCFLAAEALLGHLRSGRHLAQDFANAIADAARRISFHERTEAAETWRQRLQSDRGMSEAERIETLHGLSYIEPAAAEPGGDLAPGQGRPQWQEEFAVEIANSGAVQVLTRLLEMMEGGEVSEKESNDFWIALGMTFAAMPADALRLAVEEWLRRTADGGNDSGLRRGLASAVARAVDFFEEPQASLLFSAVLDALRNVADDASVATDLGHALWKLADKLSVHHATGFFVQLHRHFEPALLESAAAGMMEYVCISAAKRVPVATLEQQMRRWLPIIADGKSRIGLRVLLVRTTEGSAHRVTEHMAKWLVEQLLGHDRPTKNKAEQLINELRRRCALAALPCLSLANALEIEERFLRQWDEALLALITWQPTLSATSTGRTEPRFRIVIRRRMLLDEAGAVIPEYFAKLLQPVKFERIWSRVAERHPSLPAYKLLTGDELQRARSHALRAVTVSAEAANAPETFCQLDLQILQDDESILTLYRQPAVSLPPVPSAPRTCRLQVDLDRRLVFVDGQAFAQSSSLGCMILSRLIDAAGGIVPADELLPDENKGTVEPKERVKEAIAILTPNVREFIGGRPGQGGGRFLKPGAFR